MSDVDEILADLTDVPAAAGLAVDADLRLELTTAAGDSTTARVTGHGQRVRVETERPDVLLAAVDRTDVGRIAELLAATGISVAVHGPHGPVATLGAGTSNRFGRAITGSSRVAPDLRGALRLVWTDRAVRTASFAVPAALAALAAARWPRRPR